MSTQHHCAVESIRDVKSHRLTSTSQLPGGFSVCPVWAFITQEALPVASEVNMAIWRPSWCRWRDWTGDSSHDWSPFLFLFLLNFVLQGKGSSAEKKNTERDCWALPREFYFLYMVFGFYISMSTGFFVFYSFHEWMPVIFLTLLSSVCFIWSTSFFVLFWRAKTLERCWKYCSSTQWYSVHAFGCTGTATIVIFWKPFCFELMKKHLQIFKVWFMPTKYEILLSGKWQTQGTDK